VKEAALIVAVARYHEATRVMARAERILDRMIEHGVAEDRAYTIAGVGLADRRCIRAYHEMKRARRLLAGLIVAILAVFAAPMAHALDYQCSPLTGSRKWKFIAPRRKYKIAAGGPSIRKLAEMYWALALGEKPESVQSSRMIVKTSPT
jgi:hypothetical protein